ncbi:hypothetical protein KGP17_27420 (plasmid) [Serratia sp. JSRIV001]|uniref:hypothetical protein n=1 Tax=unclassified Serratia (in: enterobacteria) TaxID=2647522 RepID=UPI001CBCBF15|nr:MULTISPECIES: hypothetical protein [unclassified Serratia (in: enterobacteria)]UAN48847.1 hypothetical protein KGP17_27420 [Serratia sp. JSRIV001]UAN54497.1 hypothetical protein KGP26_28965 [Serratia sp. JSRIV002]UAN60506.1 hypothetical protein KGP21_29215 [Serratia sp. JSRIV004]
MATLAPCSFSQGSERAGHRPAAALDLAVSHHTLAVRPETRAFAGFGGACSASSCRASAVGVTTWRSQEAEGGQTAVDLIFGHASVD